MWLFEDKTYQIGQFQAEVERPVNSLSGFAVTQRPAHAVIDRLLTAYPVFLTSPSISRENRSAARDIHIEYTNARVPALGVSGSSKPDRSVRQRFDNGQ